MAGWPTHTSVGTVFFGVALAILFTIPTGIIFATTGIEVEYNVLAEFIGGAWQPGNALAVSPAFQPDHFQENTDCYR